MSRFNSTPKLLGNIRGLANTDIHVAALVHKKPILSFALPLQVVVDEQDNLLVDEQGNYIDDESKGRPVLIAVEYHYQIDPQKITAALNNEVQAAQDRLNAAARLVERLTSGQAPQGPNAPKARKMTREDLPDQNLLIDCYRDSDAALDKRLLACVMQDEYGNTLWDYQDANGHTPKLTWEFLEANPRVAEALHKSFTAWLNFSASSSEEATSTTRASGTVDSTNPTAEVSSAASLGLSSVPARTENPTTSALLPAG